MSRQYQMWSMTPGSELVLYFEHNFECLKLVKQLNITQIHEALLAESSDHIVVHRIDEPRFQMLKEFLPFYFSHLIKWNLSTCLALYVGLYRVGQKYMFV
jgi:hypothetical protein